MNKSDFLDEMRLEVGLAYDYAVSQEDFMVRILKTIHAAGRKQAVLTIHQNTDEGLKLKYALGIRGLSKKQETLGQGFLFPESLQMASYVKKGRDQALYLPVYAGTQLTYMISVKLIDSAYHISNQDLIFAEELIQFIQAKQSTFHS
ncbi:hypothetical protein [Alkalicoccus luteus]|uniref:Uncharacterized protein n=1 Tax=Alkalicoccus luteus TaxID=1237094 RepID=A0A969PU73_9BACI|nr:hypothetical protein [Alkalicoccus luteus]NJP39194.1 hypothetical protein [Alkalicoccus luteus]